VEDPIANALQSAASIGPSRLPYRRYFWLLAAAWTVVVSGSLTWNIVQNLQEVRNLASETAKALLEKDLLYRQVSFLHGGVYVPLSAEEQADPARDHGHDVETTSGVKLGYLNPAIVSRQIFEQQGKEMDIWGHLTSLAPIRSANRADPWEQTALHAFANGAREYSAIELRDGKPYFRMMRPLFIVKACLQCHEEQGRKPGELRGGISVTAPLERFATPGESARLALAHSGLWLAGILGLGANARSLRRHTLARERAEAERERLILELQRALANVKTLTGLIPICASCKKIRDDKGYWTRLEEYLETHSKAAFSHSLCLECLRKLYPDISDEVEARLAMEDAARAGTRNLPANPSGPAAN